MTSQDKSPLDITLDEIEDSDNSVGIEEDNNIIP